MKKQSASQSAFFNPRVLIVFVLCSGGVLLALAGLSKSVTDLMGNPVLETGMSATTTTAQTPGTWTGTGSMATPRAGHTATLLPNGKVLIAGGIDMAGAILSSAELYDPSTGAWMSTGSMTTPRVTHTATLLTDGKVLVAGGQNTTATSSAEIYDPGTGLWTSTGSMSTPRVAHMATLITTGALSGMVLVAGGSSVCGGCLPILDSAELYDPITGVWSSTDSMTNERYSDFSSPTILPDGSILIVGGATCCPYHWLNKAESYDPGSQTWTSTSAKTTAANQATVLLSDGKVLVAGGVKGTQPTSVNVADAELFDSATETWSATGSMSTDRRGHTLTLLPSGQALVAGGSSGGWSLGCTDLTSSELYDSTAGTWFPTGDMGVTRSFSSTATLLPNGQVLVAGGMDCAGNIRSSAELYTPPPVAALSTTSLTFGVQLVNTRSGPQSATLTNTGTTTLTISSIAASGNFVQRNDCGPSVPAGASCTIKVAFRPSAKGVQTGAVTITDDAANSPQTIALTGTGTVVQLSPSALDFGDQTVGTTSDPQTATITNTDSAELRIFGVGISGPNWGDFAATSTCGSRLAPGGSCTIDVTFTPGARGHRHASLRIVDDGGASPQAVPLAGTGVPR